MAGGSRSNAGRIGVFGASGSGKSAYTKERLRGANRVVVFDPLDEYTELPGFRSVESINDVIRDMKARWKTFRVAYVPPSGDEMRALNTLSDLLLKVQRPFREGGAGGPVTFVVEEMNLGFPVNIGSHKVKRFAEICSRGRHFGIEVIGVSQRLAEVDTRFRGNCTETVIFNQVGTRDRQAAAAILGCSAQKVGGLPKLHYVTRNGLDLTSGVVTFGRSKPANINAKPARKKRKSA